MVLFLTHKCVLGKKACGSFSQEMEKNEEKIISFCCELFAALKEPEQWKTRSHKIVGKLKLYTHTSYNILMLVSAFGSLRGQNFTSVLIFSLEEKRDLFQKALKSSVHIVLTNQHSQQNQPLLIFFTPLCSPCRKNRTKLLLYSCHCGSHTNLRPIHLENCQCFFSMPWRAHVGGTVSWGIGEWQMFAN